ncbi:alpha/beta fold hydrolase [Okibacterium fritillariae]|uniref:Acyl-CoA synthetase (AMP-forming)/AMP-acid ligase II n=1 Tax=Okibacterium fritillariae TaxID=123320 RepID=A0A1T5IAD5_9MICO|nr:alpha/beta fold hydrolase [Okibacterium fritillariae]SKC36003.1 Acyl-CoA synthetase (AMP-forming)/AMP-acid ligase II [Okibacterium fritillariae]
MPGAARTPAPASMPPQGLPGLDSRFSRIALVPDSGDAIGTTRGWHALDNGAELDRLGVTPVGTILCVHGNPTWSYLWRELVQQATDVAATGSGDAWRVIAVDQLDMGFSERTGVHRPLAQRVRDLADFTLAIGLEGPVVTLGHDWGGVVSMGWAVDHPELLSGLMLLNTAIHQPSDAPIPAPLRLALARGVFGQATVATPAFLETTLALGHPAVSRAVKDAYRAPYRGAARRGGIGGFVADIPVDASHQSFAELSRISSALRRLTVPAVMLWGPRDPIFSDRYLDDLIDRLPHADVHRFEGAGHLIAEDVDYADALLTWLGDNAARVTTGAARSEQPTEDYADTVATGSKAALVEKASDDAGTGAAASDRPLWHYLDELSDSGETALVEMNPGNGAEPRVVSWKLLSRRVREIAAGLAGVGVKKGDRVSLLVQPGADLTAVLYACLRLGAVVVVADAGLGLPGLTRAVRGAQADHVIGAAPGLAAARALGWPGQKISVTTFPRAVARALGISHTLAELVRDGRGATLPEAPAPSDTAAILFTSGSTGPAKGVVYSHAQLGAIRDTLAAQYGVGVGTGLVAGFAPFALLGPALGARSVTPDMDVTSPKTLTATAVAQAAAAVDATVVFLSPAAVTNVVATADALTDAQRHALAGVQTFLSAGAPVSESLLAAAADLMPNASAHTPYGMTEGLLMTDISLDGIRAAAASRAVGGVCVGTPAASVQVRISALDDLGQPTGEPTTEAGVTGEIVVSAPHLKSNYDRLWMTDRASRVGTDSAFADRRDAGDASPGAVSAAAAAASTRTRWHRTGDVGHLDEAGRLWVEGRLPHVIATPDGVVTPVAPEQRVESLDRVARAAVVGVGPRGTQQIVVIVETASPARRVALADRELTSSIRGVAGVPVAAVLEVPRLPTDIRHNSKIDRSGLSRWAADVLAGGRMRQP